MKKWIVVECEVSDDFVVADIYKALNLVLPYMADNVAISEPDVGADNDGQIVLYTSVQEVH